MCRWLTYRGEPIFLERLLFEPENSLIQQSIHARKAKVATNGDGFGVGWYGERTTPGLYREVRPAWNDRNLKSIAHQIRSGLFFAHVRASTGTDTARANCHPFTHGKWLFMHNGQIGGYGTVRRRLDQLIPDEVYASREGTTDSELLFLLLFRHGLDRDPATAMARTAAEVIEVMKRAGVEEPLRMTLSLSDGETLWAVRFATDEAPPSLFWSETPTGLIIVSEPLDTERQSWKPVPAGHLLTAASGTHIRLEPFQI